MNPQPNLPVLQGDADTKTPAFNFRPSGPISVVCEFAMIISFIAIPCYYMFCDLPPEFSIQQLTPIPNGPAAAAAAISSHHAFHVALRADNRRATGRCYHHGEATLTYAGFTIASGSTPEFCVPSKQAREVPIRLAWDWDGRGAGLPGHLRDRLAAAEKLGAVELEVQVRLLQGDDRPTWMWCKVWMGTAGQQDVRCSMLGLQNWFDWPV
uniref:Uncharacterized protein n=1 Tax=Avena sativa TaxID=4498 RepID=A0ACD5X0L7_AVESA